MKTRNKELRNVNELKTKTKNDAKLGQIATTKILLRQMKRKKQGINQKNNKQVKMLRNKPQFPTVETDTI